MDRGALEMYLGALGVDLDGSEWIWVDLAGMDLGALEMDLGVLGVDLDGSEWI